jgi:hypothetical protein
MRNACVSPRHAVTVLTYRWQSPPHPEPQGDQAPTRPPPSADGTGTSSGNGAALVAKPAPLLARTAPRRPSSAKSWAPKIARVEPHIIAGAESPTPRSKGQGGTRSSRSGTIRRGHRLREPRRAPSARACAAPSRICTTLSLFVNVYSSN